MDTLKQEGLVDENQQFKDSIKEFDRSTNNKEAQSIDFDPFIYSAIIHNAPDPIFVHDLQGNIKFVNDCACTITGYSKQELLNMSVKDLESNFDQEVMHGLWIKLHNEGSMILEGCHKKKDGTFYPVEIRLNALLHKDEKLVIAFIRNISIRKKAFEELKENQELLKVLLNAPEYAAFLINIEGNIIIANEFAGNILNKKTSDLVNTNFYSLIDKNLIKSKELIERAILTESNLYVEQKGINRHFAVNIYPIKSAVKIYKYVAVYIRDITDRKNKELELQKLTFLLDSIKNAQNSFISEGDFKKTFDYLLNILIKITDSEYAF